MTTLSRRGDIAAILLTGCAFALCLFLHWDSEGGFLSDDFSHIHWLVHAQSGEGLGAGLLRFLVSPPDLGIFTWRPVGFASYALDWLIFGADATGWHATSLMIHCLNAVLAGLLSRQFALRSGNRSPRFCQFATTVLFVAFPFAGESTYWPAGRFDLLAGLFAILFLMSTVRITLHGSTPLRAGMAMLFLALALLSKESAIPAIAVAALLHFALAREPDLGQSSVFDRISAIGIDFVRRFWPIGLIVLCYFTARYAMFGSAWKVYTGSQLPLDPAELFRRIASLRHAVKLACGDQPWLWGVPLLAALALWATRLKGAFDATPASVCKASVMLWIAFGLYLLAPASSFEIITPNGEGMRNLYVAWLMLSLAIACLLASHPLRFPILAIALAVAFHGQWRTVSSWHDAARQMSRILAAVPAIAREIAPDGYALLLLPDHIGQVQFIRNAQDGIVSPPHQARSYLPLMAGMSPQHFPEWESFLQDNTIGALKGEQVVFDREKFAGVYCWRKDEARFQLLDAMPHPGDAARWRAETLSEAARKGCVLE